MLRKTDDRANVIYKRLRKTRLSVGIKRTVFPASFLKTGEERKNPKQKSGTLLTFSPGMVRFSSEKLQTRFAFLRRAEIQPLPLYASINEGESVLEKQG